MSWTTAIFGRAGELSRNQALLASVLLFVFSVTSCSNERPIVVDGSSSIYPLSEAVAEEFLHAVPQTKITVSFSGSASGFRRLCAGEADVVGTSRPISASEEEECRSRQIEPLGLPVAKDGVTLVVNSANAAVECLTLEELRRLWEMGSTVSTWRDLRPGLPAERVRLLGPGSDSGTFDFFTRVVVGRPRSSRTDYHQTENDYLIARGVAGHRWALGYFGSAYASGKSEAVRAVQVNTGLGCVGPTPASVTDGSYSPLIRDLYLYVVAERLARPAVRDFISFYLGRAAEMASTSGYGTLPEAEYARSLELLASAVRAGTAGSPR